MFLKIQKNSQENSCAGVSTYQFNSPNMIYAEAATRGVLSGKVILKSLVNFTGKNLCWSMEL